MCFGAMHVVEKGEPKSKFLLESLIFDRARDIRATACVVNELLDTMPQTNTNGDLIARQGGSTKVKCSEPADEEPWTRSNKHGFCTMDEKTENCSSS
jgi:hypothetical protein